MYVIESRKDDRKTYFTTYYLKKQGVGVGFQCGLQDAAKFTTEEIANAWLREIYPVYMDRKFTVIELPQSEEVKSPLQFVISTRDEPEHYSDFETCIRYSLMEQNIEMHLYDANKEYLIFLYHDIAILRKNAIDKSFEVWYAPDMQKKLSRARYIDLHDISAIKMYADGKWNKDVLCYVKVLQELSEIY